MWQSRSSCWFLGCMLVIMGCEDPVSSGRCPAPTAAECRDPVWQQTACGMLQIAKAKAEHDAPCNEALARDAQQQTQDLVPQHAVLPAELGGGVALARVVPNPDAHPKQIRMPLSRLGFAQAAAIQAASTGALSAEEQALRTAWDANGAAVSSCREYVHEKYWDYSRFEDTTADRIDDFPAVTGVAFGGLLNPSAIGTRGANGTPMAMKDGTRLPGGSGLPRLHTELPFLGNADYAEFREVDRVRNPYYAMPSWLLEDVPAQQAALSAGRYDDDMALLEPVSWQAHEDHFQAAQADPARTLAERDAEYGRQAEFIALLAGLEQLGPLADGPGGCCLAARTGNAAAQRCCSNFRDSKAAFESRLRELFDQAVARGCVGEPSNTLCDWSPRLFVNSLRQRFQPRLEADYQRCLAVTDDDFAALARYTFRMPDGSVWTGAAEQADYTTSAAAIDQFADLLLAWRTAWAEAMKKEAASLPPELVEPGSGKLQHPAAGSSGHHAFGEGGPFGASLDFSFNWAVPGLGADGRWNLDELCLVQLQADASAEAHAWAFGAEKEVLNTGITASLQATSRIWLNVLGEPLFTPEEFTLPETFTVATDSFDETKTLLEGSLPTPFSLAGVSIMVSGGLTGKLHLDYSLEGHYERSAPNEPCWLDAGLDYRYEPWAELDGFAAVALDLLVASAGVRCDLVLLRVDTPFHLAVTLQQPEAGVDNLTFRVTSNADLLLRALDGVISLFLEFDFGFWSDTLTANLFSWAGLSHEQNLFHQEYEVNLGALLRAMQDRPE